MKKWIPALALLFPLAMNIQADEAILLQRVIALEKHVAELEARLAPVLEEVRIKEVAKQQRELAHERIMINSHPSSFRAPLMRPSE